MFVHIAILSFKLVTTQDCKVTVLCLHLILKKVMATSPGVDEHAQLLSRLFPSSRDPFAPQNYSRTTGPPCSTLSLDLIDLKLSQNACRYYQICD